MPTGLKRIPTLNAEEFRRIIQRLSQAARESLMLAGQLAGTKWMRPTGTGSNSRLLRTTAAVEYFRLTWRSGRLARSLMRPGGIENILEIRLNGDSLIGMIGSRVPYARIHELGGTINIPAHTVPVTDKMRRFFWAKYFETGKNKWKYMALVRPSKNAFVNASVLHIPARSFTMRARPFLRRTMQDKEFQKGAINILGVSFRSELTTAMRSAITNGAIT